MRYVKLEKKHIPIVVIIRISLFLLIGSSTNMMSQSLTDTLSSNLPIVVITTEGKYIRDEPKVNVHMGIIDNGTGKINTISDDFNDYDGMIGIEIRGNSSQQYPKKSYGFETRLEDGSNNNVKLIGLPRENDWVLYAPYADKSLLRNVLIFKLANDMGRYAPRTKLCELVINNDYKGVYVLMEKIKRDNDRVNIARLDEDDIAGDSLTGGYILKCDWGEGNFGWSSSYYTLGAARINYVYPDYSDMKIEQRNYIKNYVTEFESSLKSADFRDPQSGYYQYIDLGSFVDFMVCQELANNVDAYALSSFLYKDRDSNDGKLTMGPLWDFNFSFGNADYGGSQYTSTYSFNTYLDGSPKWWKRFLQDSTYTQSLYVRWLELRKDIFSTERIMFLIDSLYNSVEEASERNFDRWDILSDYVWPNAFIGHTYDAEINYLYDWTQRRLEFLDGDIPKLGQKYNIVGEASADQSDNSDYGYYDPYNPDNPQDEDDEEEDDFYRTDVGMFSLASYQNISENRTTFEYYVPIDRHVNISIYDILGQNISTLIDRFQSEGDYTLSWYGRGSSGERLASGIYIYVVHINYELVKSGKLQIIR